MFSRLLFLIIALSSGGLQAAVLFYDVPEPMWESHGLIEFGGSAYAGQQSYWVGTRLLPRFELSSYYTEYEKISTGSLEESYGRYKDKVQTLRFLLTRESNYLPNITLGNEDFFGTQLFASRYVVFGKKIDNWRASLGLAQADEVRTGAFHGGFGTLAYEFSEAPIELSFFYDPTLLDNNDQLYEEDSLGQYFNSGNHRARGLGLGMTAKWGALHFDLAADERFVGGGIRLAFNLENGPFIPNFREPKSLPINSPKKINSPDQVINELAQQGYQSIRFAENDQRVALSFSQPRITDPVRAIGRAARVLAAIKTKDKRYEQREVGLVLTELNMPLMTYRYDSLKDLRNRLVFNQPIDDANISSPESGQLNLMAVSTADDFSQIKFGDSDDGSQFKIWQRGAGGSSWKLAPFKLSTFLNDLSGAFQYDLYSQLSFNQVLLRGLYFNSSLRYTLVENYSSELTESDSLLPHVRSDVGKYRANATLSLKRLMLNKFSGWGNHFYSRLSGGIYETMFAGFGGQLAYIPFNRHWAVDVALDYVKQRDYDGQFGFLDYATLTGIMSLHYRIPSYGITMTARGGRFLAEDYGVRFEAKRRFNSGISLGAWYTITDGNDTTGPGTAAEPYYDRGLLFAIELNTLLLRDSRSKANIGISPWSRDVGQMLQSPDLYEIISNRLRLEEGKPYFRESYYH